MGRWLASLRSEKKNMKTALERTAKTDKTSPDEVLSVLSVPSVGISEKFPADGSRVSGISRPPDRQNLNAEIQEKHLPKELTKLTKPPFGSFDSDHGSHISENSSPPDPDE